VETSRKAVGGDQELKSFYNHLSQRKERAKARVAVAGKMLTRSYIMPRGKIDYAESLSEPNRDGFF